MVILPRKACRLPANGLEIAFHDLNVEVGDHAVIIFDELEVRPLKEKLRSRKGCER